MDAVGVQSVTQEVVIARSTPARIRVAAIPSQHPYVLAVCDPAAVDLLPDPVPPGAEDGRWWPPQMLDEGWIREHHDEFDVLHLHFGAESYDTGHVSAALAAAAAHGKPVVYTVHDLQNPQLTDQGEHERMLDAVIPAADALVTLTSSARAEISARWARSAEVLAHPRILGAGFETPLGATGAVLRVGVHVRDLRPNIDAVRTAATLVAAVAAMRDAGVRIEGTVWMNERVRDESAAAEVARVLSEGEGVALARGPRMTDDVLARSLADLDVCVLPYAHGTHSGWVELCHDLAVPVAGPLVGHVHAQHPAEYAAFDSGDPASLAAAIQRAVTPEWSRPGSPARAREVALRAAARAEELESVRAAHTRLYRSLVESAVAA